MEDVLLKTPAEIQEDYRKMLDQRLAGIYSAIDRLLCAVEELWQQDPVEQYPEFPTLVKVFFKHIETTLSGLQEELANFRQPEEVNDLSLPEVYVDNGPSTPTSRFRKRMSELLDAFKSFRYGVFGLAQEVGENQERKSQLMVAYPELQVYFGYIQIVETVRVTLDLAFGYAVRVLYGKETTLDGYLKMVNYEHESILE